MSVAACEVVESERLQLSPYTPADLAALYAIWSDPRVYRYTYCPRDEADAAERFVAHEAQRAIWGVAPWVLRRVGHSTVIGHGGLAIDSFEPGWGPELLYFFHADHWGQGYASELARSALAFGFETLGLSQICSFARPENAASLRVLEKAGFRKRAYLEDMQRNYYVLTDADFA